MNKNSIKQTGSQTSSKNGPGKAIKRKSGTRQHVQAACVKKSLDDNPPDPDSSSDDKPDAPSPPNGPDSVYNVPSILSSIFGGIPAGAIVVVHPWLIVRLKVDHVKESEHSFIITYTSPKRNLTYSGRLQTFRVGDTIYKSDGPLLVVKRSDVEYIPPWWDYRTLIRAGESIVHEAHARLDYDMTFLSARMVSAISKMGILPWPSMEKDVHNYLLSDSFLGMVENYHSAVSTRVDRIRMTKFRMYLNKQDLNSSTIEKYCKSAYFMNNLTFLDKLKYFVKFTLWWVIVMWCILTERLWIVPFPFIITIIYAWETFEVVWYWKRSMQSGHERPVVKYASLINIPRTCSKGTKLPDQLAGTKVSSARDQDLPCRSVPITTSFGLVIDKGNMVVPACCYHDAYNGLRIRYLFDRECDRRQIRKCVYTAKAMIEHTHFPTEYGVPLEEWMQSFPGKRRRLLESAIATMAPKAMESMLFVKKEAYLGKTPDDFKPRIIQGLNPDWQVIVGHLFDNINRRIKGAFTVHNPLTVDCGLTATELGWKFEQIISAPHLYEIDVSNWDGSLAAEWFEFERYVFELLTPDPLTREFISKHWGLVRGGGKGIRFECRHGRKSGDPWTSSFNGLINIAIVKWVFNDPQLVVIVKGDDSLIGSYRELEHEYIVEKYSWLGMKAEVALPTPTTATYCSGRFWMTDEGYRWGVSPFRVLSKFGLNLNNHPEKTHKRLLLGTAISMAPIARHVPLIGPFLDKLMLDGERLNIDPLFPEEEPWKNSDVNSVPLSCKAVDQFLEVYQMDESEYSELENCLTSISIEHLPCVLFGTGFERGFRKDTNSLPAKLSKPWYEATFTSRSYASFLTSLATPSRVAYLLALLGAFAEEGLKTVFNIYLVTLLIVGIECYCGNAMSPFVHGFLAAFPDYLLLRIIVHVAYNSFVYFSGFAGPCSIISIANKKNNMKKSGSKKTNKNQKRKQPAPKTSLSLAGPIKSAIAAALRGGGAALGGLVGGPSGAAVGRNAGAWVSKVVGSGDYAINSNNLVSNPVPEFARSNRIVSIRHREFLRDITSSTLFSIGGFSINPGDATTFPWLSGIAGNFQQYRFKGLLFEFVSTSADALNSTNTALGTVVMGTQYNVNRSAFVTKQEMEAYEFSNSVRPSANGIHPIECDPDETPIKHLYVRTGAVPSGEDARMYDLGKFYIATVGMQAASNIGELWVTYDVEFLKPRLNPTGVDSGVYTAVKNGGYSQASNILGNIQVTPTGGLGMTVGSSGAGWDRLVFPASIQSGRFFLSVTWVGIASNCTADGAGLTFSNCSLEGNMNLTGSTQLTGPSGGTNNAAVVTISTIFNITTYNASGSYIEFPKTWIMPGTNTSVSIYCIAMEAANWY